MKSKIIVDPKIMGGKPVIDGTRIPVDIILDLLGDGVTVKDILKDYYPHLTKESIQAAAKYAAHVIKGEEIHFIEKKKNTVHEAVV